MHIYTFLSSKYKERERKRVRERERERGRGIYVNKAERDGLNGSKT